MPGEILLEWSPTCRISIPPSIATDHPYSLVCLLPTPNAACLLILDSAHSNFDVQLRFNQYSNDFEGFTCKESQA
jgi:hypothetical protein